MKTLFDILNENKKESYSTDDVMGMMVEHQNELVKHYSEELHKTELIAYRGGFWAAINILNDGFKAIKDM